MFCFARLILHPPFANLCPKKTVLDAHLQILHGSTRFAALDPIHNSQEISMKKKSVTFLRSQPPPSRGHPQTAARRVMNNLKLINFLFSRDFLPSSAFSSSADLWSTSIPLLHYLARANNVFAVDCSFSCRVVVASSSCSGRAIAEEPNQPNHGVRWDRER